MKLKYIINIYGGPGVGKSTVATQLFSLMKKLNYNVEFVTEYAKELTYEGRYNVLDQDQLYVFAKQHRKVLRLKDQVEYIISDSPLLLSSVYSELNPFNIYDHDIFKKLVFNINENYGNIDILLERNSAYEYKQEGRYQDEEGAKFVDKTIKTVINKQCPKILKLLSDDNVVDKILNYVRKYD